MKKVTVLLIGLIFIVCLSGCGNNKSQDFYGTYKFEKVSYLSPLSSSSIDYLNNKMTGTKYTITADLFKIESAENTVEIRSPNYRKESVSKNQFYDARTLDGEGIKYQYTIYDKDGNKTHRRLYVSSHGLWIASYVDNTANGDEIPMEIFKLSK
jgi:hypothetical protein